MELQYLVRAQKEVVHRLAGTSGISGTDVGSIKEAIRDCDDAGCIVSTLVDRVKHNLYLTPHDEFQVNSNIKQRLHEPTLTSPSTPALTARYISTTCLTDQVKLSSATSTNRSSTLPFLLTFIALFFLALTILLHLTISRCSPRRRADYAFEKEQRNTQRAYRKLARRQAWTDWWTKPTLRRHNDPRMQNANYDEKRALISAEEAQATPYCEEELLQEEIRGLRAAHGLVNDLVSSPPRSGSAARLPTLTQAVSDSEDFMSESESLPSYRSRTSLGKLPSYWEADGKIVASSAIATSKTTGRRLSSLCTIPDPESNEQYTPDSSVVAVSPRPSYETLRSEMFFV